MTRHPPVRLTGAMRRVLILGGTGWLGREVARAHLSDGAEVTCLARGESGAVPDGARLVRADRARAGAYDGVAGDWDEVVEIAYDPALVTSALDALAGHAAHWTLISSVSVYARSDEPHADETAELVEPSDLTQYPDAKVAAERAGADRVGDRLLIARPGLIVGPGDPTDRFGYWTSRLQRGGRVVVPVAAGRHVQIIDVADLAAWVVSAARAGLTDTINAVGEIHPMERFFEVAQQVTGFSGELVPVDDATLDAAAVKPWAGPRSLPLLLPAGYTGFMQRSGRRYLEAGGMLTPLAATIDHVAHDERARGLDRERRAGLTPDEELEVLRGLPA